MKYYIIAGEASGDLHASNLIKNLRIEDPEAEIRFWGGDLMAEAIGSEPVKHYRDLAFMGFAEVLMNIKTILKNISFCKKDILNFNPDVLILVDYPGFNLRIAEFAKKNGYKVFYYISPQIWAWKEGRVEKIRKYVDRLFAILPFEKDFYKKHNLEIDFVGHPLLDAIENRRKDSPTSIRQKLGLEDKPIIALLPGSRKQEIEKALNIMLQVKDQFKDYQFVIAGAPTFTAEYYSQFTNNIQVNLVENKTYDLLQIADAALVTSGTATLETALFNVPEVVCYKTSAISYSIAKRIVNIKYISLVNLIMDKEVVKELIQDDFNSEKVSYELRNILAGPKRTKILDSYKELYKKLGGIGASKRVAKLMNSYLNE